MSNPIPLRDFAPRATNHASWPFFRKLALQNIQGAMAQISRAEQCKPGSTMDALSHLRAAAAYLESGGRPLPVQFETKREEEE